jgi:hypothetical protein
MILPDVPGHVQQAGGWFMEENIAPGSVLTLQGVSPGSTTLASTPLMIHLKNCSFTSQGRAATLWLPRPREILSLLLTHDCDLVTVGKPPNQTKIKDLATIQVWVYDYPDENQLSLNGQYWEPYSTGGATSLHIISTTLGPEGDDHDADTEAVLQQLISGYPGLTLKKIPTTPPPHWNETKAPNYGDLQDLKASGEFIVTCQYDSFAFAQAELENIPSRAVRLSELGRIKQQGRPLQELWQVPELLFSTCGNCGPVEL